MNGYKIDAVAGTVAPVTFDGLSGMQAIVGGYLEPILFPNGDVLYVDEDGLRKDQSHGFYFGRDLRLFVGNGLLTGKSRVTESGGWTCQDPKTNLVAFRAMVIPTVVTRRR